jgi:uncharacterized protein (DUF2336 family)
LDRFRDLERAGEAGRKDAALLAAIAGFEALNHPTSIDYRQFSNLFLGLFPHTLDDTRRMASAALSRLGKLPETVAAVVVDQPIRIAAPFLAFSSCVNERMLLLVIARHGIPHARAISRRKSLSQAVVLALAALQDTTVNRSLKVRGSHENTRLADANSETSLRQRNEEALRLQVKGLALDKLRSKQDQGEIEQFDTLGKLLTLQAKGPNPVRFAECLALALRSNQMLTDRIMLDISGNQLAMALQSLDIGDVHAVAVLEGVFPHLANASNGVQHSKLLLDACDHEESKRKVSAWRRANEDMDAPKATLQPLTVDIASRAAQLPAERRVRSTEHRDRHLAVHARRA